MKIRRTGVFYAQPNACPVCGPALELVGSRERRFRRAQVLIPQIRAPRGNGKRESCCAKGKIVAVKGLADSCSPVTRGRMWGRRARLLRTRKRRSDKPFALMARDLQAVESDFLRGVGGRPRGGAGQPAASDRGAATPGENARVSQAVAPGNNTVGVMLPYTPLHYLLFSDSPDDAGRSSLRW